PKWTPASSISRMVTDMLSLRRLGLESGANRRWWQPFFKGAGSPGLRAVVATAAEAAVGTFRPEIRVDTLRQPVR
ncbi:MAG: hypothetical protein QE285_14610, partial [Aquabacterium sp.]|nr:hypothetical protein [Aquabacterium sp.]